jgi:hypothetical protein
LELWSQVHLQCFVEFISIDETKLVDQRSLKICARPKYLEILQ